MVLGMVNTADKNYLTLIDTPVRAGFPSPADDYLETKLDLTEHLVKHPSATYYIKAAVDSELTCKCLGIFDNQHHLLSGNSLYPPIPLVGKDVHIWGIVIHTIHSLRKRAHV